MCLVGAVSLANEEMLANITPLESIITLKVQYLVKANTLSGWRLLV